MNRFSRGLSTAVRGWAPNEDAAARRASWPMRRLVLAPLTFLSLATMIIAQWVTGADDHHVSFVAYGGLFTIGTGVLVGCVALEVGWRIRDRKTARANAD